LHRGVVFGFRAAVRVNREAANFVYHDVRNIVLSTYGGEFIGFPEGGSYAIGMSVNLINITSNVVEFQNIANETSSDIQKMHRQIFEQR